MKTDLSQYNNAWYQPGSFFKRISWMVMNALFFNHSMAILNGFKCALIRWYGGKVGKGVIIKPSVNIKYPWFLQVGDYVWIGERVWIDSLTHISLGNNVCLSQGSMLLTGNHDYTKTTFDLVVKPIVLEEGAWIGARSVVCPGVTCGSHSVLAVGSVASKDLAPYSINRGNPAVFIKQRTIQ